MPPRKAPAKGGRARKPAAKPRAAKAEKKAAPANKRKRGQDGPDPIAASDGDSSASEIASAAASEVGSGTSTEAPPRKAARRSEKKTDDWSDLVSEASDGGRRRERILEAALNLVMRTNQAQTQSASPAKRASAPEALSELFGDPSRAPVAELIKVPEAVWRAVQGIVEPGQRIAKIDSVLQAVGDAYMRPMVPQEVLRRFQSDHFGFIRRLLSIALSGSSSALADITTLLIRRAQWANVAALKGYKAADKFLLDTEGLPGVRDVAFERALAVPAEGDRRGNGQDRRYGRGRNAGRRGGKASWKKSKQASGEAKKGTSGKPGPKARMGDKASDASA